MILDYPTQTCLVGRHIFDISKPLNSIFYPLIICHSLLRKIDLWLGYSPLAASIAEPQPTGYGFCGQQSPSFFMVSNGDTTKQNWDVVEKSAIQLGCSWDKSLPARLGFSHWD